ncbi:LIM domain only protein 7 isoform X14 [Onychostoma macrolepis]|uniref:LIM domain only protein 7 isoform X14 n=1 Tax=Onychostoma macrolepis TaxID=369639 RepID=UPI00272A0309|nr:LIM domain only protein 7 isoform X14 [Onychostoma macrolepis]
MEWRPQSSVGYEAAYSEAQRWIEAVTKKKFVSSNFRSSLENGLLLCDLINKIRPGVVKRLNRLSTPIAGLDNISLFLKACAKLGLKEAQLFHPGDLQDLSTRVTVKHQESSRRLKNVLITIYWLGRKAHSDPFYNGPYLNLKAFEGLLGKALYKILEDCTSLQGSVRNSSCRDSWYSEKEELFPLQAGHRREDSLDSLNSLGSRTYSTSSDATLKGSSEGCGSDPEADLSFMMSENKEYRRSLVIAPKTTTPYNQFLPSKDKQSCYVPAPLRKKRAERNDEDRRSWASPMFTEDDGTFTRSKSVSDITEGEMNLSNLSMELRVEEMQKMRARLKENEDKWQDDLTRWKNKRKSVNSDIVKKKEEREQVEQIISGGIRKSKTFKEMQDERESRQKSNYRDSFNSDDVFEEPVPRSRTLPARSYTIDTPYAPKDKPSVPSIPSLREKEPVAGTLASDQTDFHTRRDRTSPDIPLKMNNNIEESQTTTRSLLDDPVPALSSSNTSLIKPASISKTSGVLNSSELISNTKPVENSSGPISSLYKPNSMDTKQSGLAQVSASLPRSYQRSDSARLTSVVTPRPFGTQSNRITSLPRAFTVDESLKRTNGETDSLKKTTASNRYAQYVKEDISQESPVQSSDEEEEEEKTPSPIPPVNRVSPLPKSPSPLILSNEVDYSEMRISLNQKPNSSRDFGFQSNWDSTGVRVKSIVPGSPAELGQVKVGDEILTVNGHRVADLSYTEWKNRMEEALQQGSLLMDIRRQGKNNWGRDLPSLPFKSHKTINLTSLDPLGPSEPYLSTNLDFTSQQTKDMVVKTVNVSSQSGNNYGLNGINGGFHEDSETLNNKESITLKNLKRRSEFFEQGLTVSSLVYLCGGSDTAISNLPVPSITTSTTRWSWDPEEERKRQAKWQKEQERVLQEKYKKDQEKLDEEWRKAQQDLEKENLKKHEEEMRRLEERRRREEHERLEEEKKKREEEERKKREQERLRLEEERRKREEQERLEEEKKKKREEEERKKREQERLRLEEERRKREDQERLEELRRKREEEERLLQEKERNRREEERRRLEEQKRYQEQDMVDSFGYTNVYPQLSYSHRSISKSTPELDEVAKPDIKGVYGRHRGLAGWLLEEELRRKKNSQIQREQAASELELERRSILNAMKYRDPERASGGLGEFSRDYKKEPQSQSEVERQQILHEMRKKTSLNTDNSWIRQQSAASASASAKEPIDLPIRKGESLDNLDMPWRTSWSTSNSTSSIPDYSRPHSSLSGSSLYQSGRPGSATLQSSQSMSSLRQSWSPSAATPEPEPRAPPRNRSVSGRKICSFCNSPLGKGAAMIIESLGLCYHLSCFKCINCRSDLGGSEAGAEVRIRNQQLYCNSCYMRLKTGQPTAM